ncbi:hypothetical protein P152DRAFT_458587 [Eremomyces bilateralis CBS 781.70]|uniref:Spindle pole body component n=1 Tax=Eremomyces bilateralis CBS 781.70 TaxID=1392243 RepID=A0A6G1G2B0_9PEZI|nr:uncharacterized protein P152DRAFT_458587 [Eremomyces bilateralis CBS 781.70]KAF1812183.1 hypothetical protein P152DRAFT_458587 [Eremomyces bilateralis CBS 781.70]
MAHSSTVGSLVGALAGSITGLSEKKDHPKFKRARDHAVRNLRSHSFVRPSQFETKNAVDGLVEKFQVLGRDDLADALGQCLGDLTAWNSKWTPEYLALLLELSQDPVRKGQVKETLHERALTLPLRIDWKNIIAKSRQKEIWEDIDYAAQSSDDEEEETMSEPEQKPRTAQELPEDDIIDLASYVVPVDETAHLSLFSPFPKDETFAPQTQRVLLPPQVVPEIFFIRESLSMLHGLPTSLYFVRIETKKNVSVQLSGPPIFFESATVETCKSLSRAFADLGASINVVRTWHEGGGSIPWLEAFQDETRAVIRSFDASITQIEQGLLRTTSERLISALSVLDSAREAARVPVLFSRIAGASIVRPGQFSRLDGLYDMTCQCQITEPPEVFQRLATTLHRCLEVYLRPVQRWVFHGEWDDENRVSFLRTDMIGTSFNTTPTSQFRGGDNIRNYHTPTSIRPEAPKFFHQISLLKAITNAGLAVQFLKRLGYTRDDGRLPRHESITLIPFHGGADFIPLELRVEDALQKWTSEATTGSQTRLYEAVVHGRSFMRYVDGLHAVFLATDKSAFAEFSDAVILAIRQAPAGMLTDSAITALAQNYLGQVPPVDGWRIKIYFPKEAEHRNLVEISRFELQYKLPWYVQNVVQHQAIEAFQRIFSLLLLMSFAKTSIEQQQISFRTRSCPHGPSCAFCTRLSALRHRFLVFLGIFASYVTVTVLEPAIAGLRNDISTCARFDVLCELYDKFADTVESRCLASEKLRPIFEAMEAILVVGIRIPGLRATHLGREGTVSAQRGTGRYIPGDSDSDADEDLFDEFPNGDNEKDVDGTVRTLQEEFGRRIRFAVAGLHGIGRAGDDSTWSLLAARLEPLVTS